MPELRGGGGALAPSTPRHSLEAKEKADAIRDCVRYIQSEAVPLQASASHQEPSSSMDCEPLKRFYGVVCMVCSQCHDSVRQVRRGVGGTVERWTCYILGVVGGLLVKPPTEPKTKTQQGGVECDSE